MEAQWQADRSRLRDLIYSRADLSLKQITAQLGRSYSWAKRLAAAPPEDLEVLHSRSRARKTAPPGWDLLVLRRIEQIRLFSPEGLQRTPGPKAILSYLPRDEQLRERGYRLPRSTRSICKCLHQLGCLPKGSRKKHEPLPLCEPLEEIQVDVHSMLVRFGLIPVAKASKSMWWRSVTADRCWDLNPAFSPRA